MAKDSQEITTSQLLALADAALSQKADVQSAIPAIAQYSEAFNAWYAQYCSVVDKNELAGEIPQFEELDKKHREVLQFSKDLMVKSQKDLRALKVKGKGIMAYLDMLPGQISIRRPRKG